MKKAALLPTLWRLSQPFAATSDRVFQAAEPTRNLMKATAEEALEAVPAAADTGLGAAEVTQPIWQQFLNNPASWFLLGCIFTLILIIIVEYIAYKKNR